MINIYDNINEIIYINLDFRKDRKTEIESIFNKYFKNIKITRFNAVKTIKELNLLNKNLSPYLTDGAIGGYYSHIIILYNLYKKYVNLKSNKYVLIFEDDTLIDNNFIDLIKSDIPINNWNIILGINDICNVNINKLNLYDSKKHLIFGTNLVIYNLMNIEYLYKKIISIKNIIDYDKLLLKHIDSVYFFDTKYIYENKNCSDSNIR